MSNPVTWFEVHASDAERAKAFYGDAFGWTFDDSVPGYSMVAAGADAPIGGGITTAPPGTRPMAIFNVQVPDVAAACDRVGELGGTVVVGKQSTPFGLDFAYVADPDGNTFGVWTPPAAPPGS